mgnify:FL=1
MQIELKRHRKALVVRLKGELDHHTAEGLRAKLDEEIKQSGDISLVLSLKGLTFMDSSGIGVILGRYRQIHAGGGKMVVCGVHPHLHRLFEMSGLYKIIALENDEKAALASLGVAL